MPHLVPSNSPLLRKVSSDFRFIPEGYEDIQTKMIDVLIETEGLAVAAPQIGANYNIILLNYKHIPEDCPTFLLNVRIDKKYEPMVSAKEGCLSLPGVFVDVERHESIEFSYQKFDINGPHMTGFSWYRATGLLSRIIQHEVDHINGVLITDYVQDNK